jgi:hypothetical protein
MTNPSGTDKSDHGVQPHHVAVRKPYVKPSFQSQQVFETMALSCGKISGTQGACHQNRKNS